jgi:hypothetical protein
MNASEHIEIKGNASPSRTSFFLEESNVGIQSSNKRYKVDNSSLNDSVTAGTKTRSGVSNDSEEWRVASF